MIIFDSKTQIYYSTKINDESYFSGFSTRSLGNGMNAEAVLDFFQKKDISLNNLIIAKQPHKSNIGLISSDKTAVIQRIADVDGLITKDERVALVVVTADCVPVIYADKKRGLVGVSHQGWRGILKRLPQKMIEKLKAQGSDVKDINIAIGPSIGACCYVIKEDLYSDFSKEFSDYSDKIFHIEDDGFRLNLTKLTYLLCKESNIPENNIDYFPFCTSCNEEKFFSVRRAKKDNLERMFNFVVKLI